MTRRTSIHTLRSVLLAAVGVAPLSACGGAEAIGQPQGQGGASTGGTNESGGAVTTGGALATGGGRATGGAPATGGALAAGGASTGGASTGGTGPGGAGGTTTGGASSGGGSPTGGTGGVAPEPWVCRNPTPVPGPEGRPSGGLFSCDDGVIHRGKPETCIAGAVDPSLGPYIPSQITNPVCRTHGDCTERPYGSCVGTTNQWGMGLGNPACAYGCLSDSDCAEGSACICGTPFGSCMSGCSSDAECNGKPCAYITSGSGCMNYPSLRCGVQCQVTADCTAGQTCVNGGCLNTSVACGRPFLVGGTARVAPPAIRRDWIQDSAPSLDALSPEVCAALAAHWTKLGLMEHASIAAFARFVLQLLSLGAPASLVASATAALGDETEHARLCFGIASAYAGTSIGPGALPMESALDGGGFAEIVRTAFLEACVGETCAALEAAECAEHATDPFIAGALRRIAADETRHAELGWRFVTWALERADAGTRRNLLREFGALVTASEAAPSSATGDDAALLAHAVPSPALRFATRGAAVGDVVQPCLAALSERFGESVTAGTIAAAA